VTSVTAAQALLWGEARTLAAPLIGQLRHSYFLRAVADVLPSLGASLGAAAHSYLVWS